jgi:hypothetical protein
MFGTRIQCTTVLTALLITLNAMIPISTLQYLETSPLSPHSTPEHDFIGQHAKTLQAGEGRASKQQLSSTQQQDQPRSARTVGLELSLCKPRLSLSFPSPSPIPLHQLDSHSSLSLSPLGMHVKHVLWKKGPKTENVDHQPITTSNGSCQDGMEASDVHNLQSHSLPVCCLFAVFCLLPSKHHCHEAGESTK